MPKKVLQDMLPPKKSIRNIPLPEEREIGSLNKIDKDVKKIRVSRRVKKIPAEIAETPIHRQRIFDEEVTEKSLSKIWMWLLAIVFVFVVVFGVLSLFSSASVTILPKTQTLPFNAAFSVNANGAGADLQYQMIKISRDGGKQINSTANQKVETKASGTIIIYNNNSNNLPQKLVAGTRFQTPEGLIFKINKTTTVPARKQKSGEYIPGSIEAGVTADTAGADYNMGLKDFTLPGFKGDPKYTTVYARSKTEMTGGFSGVVKKVSDADMAAAKTSIEGDLKSSLNKDVIAQVPPDYILYNNAIFYSFQTLPQSDISTSTAKINERGTAYGLMLNKKDLQLTILKKASIDSSGSNSSDINITNLDKLVLTLSDNSFLPDKNSLFNFNLKGDLSLVWQTDVQKLKKDLAGKPKDGLNTVLSSYPSIDEARAVVRPIWKTTFPGNPDKINVIIKNKIK